MPHVVVGTAGHIDHGKTALVKALTGTDTDRLEEEKQRGMTIDLGFAFLNDTISITDVPGHEKFIRNMVAGVSTIHMALIAIAADDGIMPQTREHLEIIELLGIENAVIALTKTDAVIDPEWIDLVEEEIHELINQTELKGSPLIRTSVVTGEGIEQLKEAIITMSESIHKRSDRGFFRMPVDRVFSKPGFGTVVTGTVMSGTLKTGGQVRIEPESQNGKVRGLQSHGKAVNEVSTGDRAAVNISGVDNQKVFRGSELSEPGFITSSDQFIANISLLNNTGWELKNRQKVHLHIGTAETLAVVSGLKKSLKGGDTSNAVLITSGKLSVAVDDRLILRSYSPVNTIGGGKILSVNPSEPRKRLNDLAAQLPTDLFDRFIWLVNQEYGSPKSVVEWSKVLNQNPDLIMEFVERGKLEIGGPQEQVFNRQMFESQKDDLLKLLTAYLSENKFRSSMNIEQLRKNSTLSTQWFDHTVGELISLKKMVRTASGFSLPGHEIIVSEKDKTVIDNIEKFVNSSGFTLVSRDLINEKFNLSEDILNSFLHFLKENHRLHEIENNAWVSNSSFEEMKLIVVNHFNDETALDVSIYKSLTGLTRKSAIPWLEFLDRKNITERSGNTRIKGEDL